MYCAFLDASKAFDKVLHNGLFVKLLKRNVSVAFVQIIRNWYSKLTASVLWNNILGQSFSIDTVWSKTRWSFVSNIIFYIFR